MANDASSDKQALSDKFIQSEKPATSWLFQQLKALPQSRVLQETFSIQAAQCMGVCDRACAIALVGANKFTYLFGNLPSDGTLEITASTVLDCAEQYCSRSDGILPYRERPKLLRDTIIAKIPPLPVVVV